jgi:hypothetical protein
MLKWLSLFGSRAIVERCRHEFKKNFLCLHGNHLELVMHVRIILEMTGCCLHLLGNIIYAYQATDWLLRKRRSPRTSLSSFMFSQQDLSLELYAVVHILRIQQPYLSDIYSNLPFGHTKSEAWFHLTKAESQAAMIVSDPQGFDIGLCENPTMLMLWLTQLAGRPIAIIPWFLKNNHSPWGFCVTYSRSYPLWSLSTPKVWPLLDD